MTALVALVCEAADAGGRCGRRSAPLTCSPARARQYFARTQGWTVRDGQDLCAHHNPDRPPRPQVWPDDADPPAAPDRPLDRARAGPARPGSALPA